MVAGETHTGESAVANPAHPTANRAVPEVSDAAQPSLSAPLSLMPSAPRTEEEGLEHVQGRIQKGGGPDTHGSMGPFRDAALDLGAPSPRMPPIDLQFSGEGMSLPGFHVGGIPPDTNGDVSADYYVQVVNVSLAVFSKAGALLLGPIGVNHLFAGFSGGEGLCASTNRGDPLVRYDQIADRWLVSQFAFTGNGGVGSQYQCVAISTSGDPRGSYYRYAFGPYTVGGRNALNDYGKVGVWPDGYYLSYNMFTSVGVTLKFVGAKFCALDRANLLAGNAARQVCFQLFGDPTTDQGYGGALPSDMDGRYPPPLRTPNLFIADDNTPDGPDGKGDVLQVWKLYADWDNPDQSTITDTPANCPSDFHPPCPDLIPVQAFRLACNNGSANNGTCVPQPGTSQKLDTLGDRLMYRLVYRNFSGQHESLIFNRTVEPNANGPAGIRWYELRNSRNGTMRDALPVIAQQATYAPPDSNWRWMGSMAMDHQGNIGLGISLSSEANRPSIFIAGRQVSDPPNTLPEQETLVWNGTGSQSANRWGDYSMMAIDPSDDCTFWYTTEYLKSNGAFNWDTRVARFKFSNCAVTEGRYGLLEFPGSTRAGKQFLFEIKKLNPDGELDQGYNGTATFTSTDPKAALPDAVTFTNGVATGIPLVFKTAGFRTVWATDATDASIIGVGSAVVAAEVASSYAISGALPSHVLGGQAVTLTVNAKDSLGNLASDYVGTAAVTSSDPDAVVPTMVTFLAGAATLTVRFNSSGPQSVTFIDMGNPALTATAATSVLPASFIIAQLPPTLEAGTAATFDITAVDGLNRIDTTYGGSVVVTSNDPQAVLPSNPQLTHGVASGVGITLKTAGARSVVVSSVDDSTLIGRANANVQPSSMIGFAVRQTFTDFPTDVDRGASITIVVSAKDRYGNTTPSYQGMANFTSSDPQADVPPVSVFRNGVVNNLHVLFRTSGMQSLTATDTAIPALSGTVQTLVVPAKYRITAASPVYACGVTAFAIATQDADGTLDPTYQGKALIATSDPRAVVPMDVKFADGVGVAQITLKTPGDVSVTAKDALVSRLTGAVEVSVGSDVSIRYAISALPDSVTAGTPARVTLTAQNGCGDLRSNYAGIAHLTSSDPRAVLPADPAFTAGVAGGVPVTFETSGMQTVTATDAASPSTVASANTVVQPGPLATYEFIGLPPSLRQGSRAVFSLTAKDAYDNVADTYAGAVQFSSSDPHAQLPGDQAFDHGLAAGLSVVFATSGPQTLTASDARGSAVRSNFSIAVSLAPLPSVAITGPDEGATVSTEVTLGASASVDSTTALQRIDFLVDDAVVGSATSTPASYTWDSATVPNGPHLIRARVTDGYSNSATAAVHVTVANTESLTAQQPAGGCGCATGGSYPLAGAFGSLMATRYRSRCKKFKGRAQRLG